MSTATTMSPAQAVRTHREVRHAHQALQHALDECAGDDVRHALTRAADALRTDPTLALDPDTQRTLALILELTRQIKPLGRQAVLARTHARLLADPDLSEHDRARRINQLGKTNPLAIEEEQALREHLRAHALELAGRACPDWERPDRFAELARQQLPSPRRLERLAGELRQMVAAAASLDPREPEVRRLLELADQIHSDHDH